MQRIITGFILATMATVAVAQQPAKDSDRIAATINGEVITKAKLDMLYMNMNSQMRSQYERAGGKMAFLDNYIGKRLLLQEALKSGFEQRADVKAAADAARESALFDRYVRDVVGGEIITDAMMRAYYEENKQQFATPETARVYHIVVSEKNRSHEDAWAISSRILRELAPQIPETPSEGANRVFLTRFGEAAKKFSEDSSGAQGGDLGWVARGALDPKFEEVAFAIPLNTMSDIIETKFGHHLVYVTDRRPSGFKTFDQVMPDIRERLSAQKSAEIMTAVRRMTNELRQASRVTIYKENVE
jgi:peptidyl-prolyl cis-trans isomerase C